MNNKTKYIILILSFLFIITGCNYKSQISNEETDKENIINNSDEVISAVKITINNKEYEIILEDNETAKEFIQLLPKEFNMNELNGNEKYVYLDNILSETSSNPKHIKAGDVMLYGNNCLVIFYKSFDTSYSYTKIGHIDNLPNLGSNSIKVKFEK